MTTTRKTDALRRHIADHAAELLAPQPNVHPDSPLRAGRDLRTLREMRQLVDWLTEETVSTLRREDYSWQWIGDTLGVTRQAAQQRYGS